jgi:hypothetical protein
MDRRQFIATTGTAAAVTLAGCGILGGDDDTDSPESVTEAFLEADDADEAGDLLHPESPLQGELEDGEDDEEQEVEVNDVSIEEEDLGVDALESQWVSSEVAETIADQDNAVTMSDVDIDGESADWPVLTAQDDGDWLVVMVGLPQ